MNGSGARAGFRDRIVELRRVRASELVANPKNWRRHPERQRRALRALLGEIGFSDALIARVQDDGRLILLDGHLRRELSPEQEVPVLVTDLSEQEGDELLATLDPVAALAVADPGPLKDLLDGVRTRSATVRELLESLARGARLPVIAGRTEPDEAPSPPPEPRTGPGDLWCCGPHRILCGDARSGTDLVRALGGEVADVLWTDPPYGVTYVGKTAEALRLQGDRPEGLRRLLEESFRAIDSVLRPGAALYVAHPAGASAAVFAAAFAGAGWEIRQGLVWVKDTMVLGHGDYHYRHEPLLYGRKPGSGRLGRGGRGWYGGNAETSVFEVPRPRASTEHPTQKPTELIRRCLANSCGPEGIVLDPFLGSGSTLIACHQLGRRFAGVEIEPRYVDAAVARWEAFTGERAVRG